MFKGMRERRKKKRLRARATGRKSEEGRNNEIKEDWKNLIRSLWNLIG